MGEIVRLEEYKKFWRETYILVAIILVLFIVAIVVGNY